MAHTKPAQSSTDSYWNWGGFPNGGGQGGGNRKS